jgi:KDO2-lipid IV(A) lauroyltransferase
MMLSGHVFNWEWFNSLATIIPQEKCFPIYRKMQSFWEEKIRKLEADMVMKL